MTGAFLNLCFFEAFNVWEQHERQLDFESGPLHDSRTCLLVGRGLSSLPGGYLVLQGCQVVLLLVHKSACTIRSMLVGCSLLDWEVADMGTGG